MGVGLLLLGRRLALQSSLPWRSGCRDGGGGGGRWREWKKDEEEGGETESWGGFLYRFERPAWIYVLTISFIMKIIHH